MRAGTSCPDSPAFRLDPDGVVSEKAVHSPHSTQSDPETIEEVRRILLLHAAEWSGSEVPCEGPASAAAGQP